MSIWEKNKVGCILLEKDAAMPFHKGDKRTQKPVIEQQKCTQCGICYLYCPDACLRLKCDGFYDIDLDYCKGCGICSQECWFGAIQMVEEN